MWGTSDAFAVALAQRSRSWRARVDILFQGQLVRALDVLMDGAIALDSVAVRRAGTFSIIDPSGELTPSGARDLLAPKGTEVRPFRGLVLADGSVEWVPLGVLGIKTVVINRLEGGGSQSTITAADRVEAVRRRRFTEPYAIHNGTPTHLAIRDIVTSRLPVDHRLTQTGHTVPDVVYDRLSDPWEAVKELAEADTLSAFFDPLGSLAVVRDEPVRTGIVYRPGEGSLLLDTERELDNDRAYSGVVVKVEHPDIDPIYAEAWDTNPASPTYHLGPFGRVPYGFSSPIIKTQAQAQEAASRILLRVSRMRQTGRLTILGHPGHDVGDLIEVVDPATRTSGEWVITGGSIPLRPKQPITLKIQEPMPDA